MVLLEGGPAELVHDLADWPDIGPPAILPFTVVWMYCCPFSIEAKSLWSSARFKA